LYKYSEFRKKIIPQKSDSFGAVFSPKPFVYESHWIDLFLDEKKS
jgi:hypothetical protein